MRLGDVLSISDARMSLDAIDVLEIAAIVMGARTEKLTEPVTEGLDKLLESVASAFASSRLKSLAANRSISLASRRNPSAIADRIASDLPIEVSEKQELPELLNPPND